MSQPQESNRTGLPPRKATQLQVVVTILAALIALVFAVKQGSHLVFQDEIDFHSIARNLASQGFYSVDGIRPTAFRQPGWPIVMAAVIKMGGGVMVCRLLNVLLYVGGLVAGSRLASRLFGERAGSVFAVLALMYPILAFTAGTLYPQTLAALLLLITLNCLWDPSAKWPKAALAGLVFGYLCLTVSTFAAFGPFLLAIPFLVRQPQKAASAVVFCIAAGIMVAPWLARNAVVMGKATFSTNMGYNLALGNSPNAGPNTGVSADINDFWPAVHKSEVYVDGVFASRAVEWVKENPGRAASLYVAKFANFFGCSLGLATEGANGEGGEKAKTALLFVTYYSLLGLALARFLLTKQAALLPSERLAWGLYLLFGVVSAVFFTRIRFRLPVDFLLILLATQTVCLLLDRPKATS